MDLQYFKLFYCPLLRSCVYLFSDWIIVILWGIRPKICLVSKANTLFSLHLLVEKPVNKHHPSPSKYTPLLWDILCYKKNCCCCWDMSLLKGCGIGSCCLPAFRRPKWQNFVWLSEAFFSFAHVLLLQQIISGYTYIIGTLHQILVRFFCFQLLFS